MKFPEYESYDALGLAALVKTRDIAPGEILDAMIERVEARNPKVNAVVIEAYDQARAAIAAGLPDGPFAGVPYLIKDLHAPVAGLPLSHASRLWQGSVFDFDSETVARLRRAGFVIAGRTNAPELGMNVSTEPALYGAAHNPWSLDRSTGGSSGGAAAAVASGMLPAAHATDSLGSIRVPASCCGLVGLKPTRGRNPVGPHRGDAMQGLSHEHCVSRSVRDSAAILDATNGPDEGAPWFTAPPVESFLSQVGRDPGQLRIGLVTEAWSGAPVDLECKAAVEHAGKLCEDRGHRVAPVELSHDGQGLIDACNLILFSGLGGLIAQREAELGRKARRDELEPLTWAVADAWRGTLAMEMHGALARINRWVRQTARAWRSVDVVITPTLAQPPVKLGVLRTDTEDWKQAIDAVFRYCPFTPLFSASGQPAMSLPLHKSRDGLPIGVQCVARFGEDATLFRLAAQLESDFIGASPMVMKSVAA
ncbi:MAG TPA: amidase [Stellaceae bacterium]|nr:amidase [Stellaceae bacterium]